MSPKELWIAKRRELWAARGQVTYEIGQKEAALREIDDQLRALEATTELAAGLEEQQRSDRDPEKS